MIRFVESENFRCWLYPEVPNRWQLSPLFTQIRTSTRQGQNPIAGICDSARRARSGLSLRPCLKQPSYTNEPMKTDMAPWPSYFDRLSMRLQQVSHEGLTLSLSKGEGRVRSLAHQY